MEALDFVAHSPLFAAFVFLFGLLVGSFLNVVIYRLPIMLERIWRRECREFLELQKVEERSEESVNLVFPGSRCPLCQHPLRPHENIPVLSYLFLRGKCSHCKGPISFRYPLVEIITALVSGVVAWVLGPTWQTAWALVLSWALICLSAIDIDRRLLPDAITLPFLWLGLFLSLFNVVSDVRSSVIGAIAGYLSLWLVYHAFKLVTGKEGMGHGDFKLLAVLGAWLGWEDLPLIVLLSSLVGAVAGIAMIVWFRQDRSNPIPFGPYLAMAGWIALLWGDEIIAGYLRVSGLV